MVSNYPSRNHYTKYLSHTKKHSTLNIDKAKSITQKQKLTIHILFLLLFFPSEKDIKEELKSDKK